jgi:hypothetical protein
MDAKNMHVKNRGPFRIEETDEEIYVYFRGLLIHKRWRASGVSRTLDKYGFDCKTPD